MIEVIQFSPRKKTSRYCDESGRPNVGYSRAEDGYHKRLHNPGAVAALSIPAGLAINSGIGMMTPFGGAEGYKAVFESEDDPSKTSNVIGEVGAKYILGRTGGILPWDEFKKVRPDVSKDEQTCDTRHSSLTTTDMDPTDGDIILLTGVIKATSEGIHGPEVQFLGRSLPVNTALFQQQLRLVAQLMAQGSTVQPKD